MTWMNTVRAAALALLAGACAQQTPAGDQAYPVHREEVVIETAQGPVSFQVEMAVSPADRNRGLMHRRHLDPDHGMLFDFNPPQPVSFWMRNTYIPLDIIFVGPDGTILNIAENTTPLSDAGIPSSGPVRGVLEINAGLARERGIAPGDRVRHRLFPGG